MLLITIVIEDKKLLLGTSIDSLFVGYIEIDNWLSDIEDAEDWLYGFIDESEEELLNMEDDDSDLLAELKQQLLNDEVL
ncbi:MAG: hypothetical protein MJ133_07610 [Lachnospiraceae bacterium]|nr:hypothetical protein [Lachnospiraceae bacterium]